MPYFNNPKFSSFSFLQLADRELISFMIKENFNVNKAWTRENPVLHLMLANEWFGVFERFLNIIPKMINPNLCDGIAYGKKSLLIILTMLVSNGNLPLKFIELYKDKLTFDYQDASGRTALHYAIILGRQDIVKALILGGASFSIKDAQGKTPFEYVGCSKDVIQQVLKQIDIDPNRDTNASTNSIKDYQGRNIFLQGTLLVQSKFIVGNVMKGFMKHNTQLIRYIKGGPTWGTFIGDNTTETREELRKLVVSIVQSNRVSVNEVYDGTELTTEKSDFVLYLKKLYDSLSGSSVLERCLQGHKVLGELLKRNDNREEKQQYVAPAA